MISPALKILAPSLRVIAAGGTFDKHYDPIKGELVFAQSQLPTVLANARIADHSVVEVAMQIDSLFMTDEHRQTLLAACKASQEQHIIIVHGTDTMTDTAQVLGKANLSDKTIVLTGAMVPFSIEHSDASFNLGFATACARTLAPGVYVAMNATVFVWDNVRKNRQAGFFESIR